MSEDNTKTSIPMNQKAHVQQSTTGEWDYIDGTRTTPDEMVIDQPSITGVTDDLIDEQEYPSKVNLQG